MEHWKYIKSCHLLRPHIGPDCYKPATFVKGKPCSIIGFCSHVRSALCTSLEAKHLILMWVMKVKGPKIKLILLKYYMFLKYMGI